MRHGWQNENFKKQNAMQKIKVATFQRRPLFDDVAQTGRRLTTDILWCEDNGIDLAIFPECYLQGYTTDRQTIADRAMPVDGRRFQHFLSALPHSSTDVILGFIEARADGLFNSAALIVDGRVKGLYAKRHPNEAAFTPGCDAPVFSRCGFSFGINICFDANFPDCAQLLSAQGARLICYPLNNMLFAATAEKWRERSLENLRRRAIETGCWVASSDVVGVQGQQISFGCTYILNPQGLVVASVPEGAEGVAVYEIR